MKGRHRRAAYKRQPKIVHELRPTEDVLKEAWNSGWVPTEEDPMIFHAWGETAAPSGGFGRSLDRDDPYEAKKIKFTEERAGAIEIEVSNNGITGGVLVRSTSRSIVQFKSVIVRTGDTFTLTFEKATVGP